MCVSRRQKETEEDLGKCILYFAIGILLFYINIYIQHFLNLITNLSHNVLSIQWQSFKIKSIKTSALKSVDFVSSSIWSKNILNLHKLLQVF